jgi:NAD(P)-dependent dehydrogenase (short-subunit alcohol dehydrogenase family)
MWTRLTGMNFLITGAGRGIGLELTQFALEAGHTVYALVRDPNNARTLYQLKKTNTELLHILQADVTVLSQIQAVQNQFSDISIDVLINNAGVLLDDEIPFAQVTPEQMQETFSVNSFAPVFVTQTFLPNLKKSKSAKLINITSLMGSIEDNSSGGYYAYRMSKTALNMFTKSFAIDHPNITALTLHPGWVRTDMGGARAPLLPRESARGLFRIILEATNGQSGLFLDYTGKRLSW